MKSVIVDAYAEALDVYTRDSHPMRWARAQYNIGTNLTHLGASETGEESLARSITILTKAMQIYTRDDYPQDWMRVQVNLANAYRLFYDKTKDQAYLDFV